MLLNFPRRVVIVIVQPNLSHRQEFGFTRQTPKVLKMRILGLRRFMRMNARCRLDPVVGLGNVERRPHLLRATRSTNHK